jgi:hypothetical protein
MTYSKHTDALTIREIQYSIRIKDKNKGTDELHDLLRSELTRFDSNRQKVDKVVNPIHDFLQTNIERSIVIRDNTRVYFLNYKEHGSLTIEFTLLVITRYVNYGATRQALDYLVKDTIGDYFEELLERHLPVSVSVQTADSELYDFPESPEGHEKSFQNRNRDYLPVVLSSIALFMAIAVVLFLFFRANTTSIKSSSDDYKDKYYNLLIEKTVKQAIENERNNYRFNNYPEAQADSILRSESSTNH